LSIAELRRYIYDLRPVSLDRLGLTGALEFQIAEVTDMSTVRGRLVILGRERSIAPAAEACLYRVAQEAINNIVKHASVSAAVVRLSLRRPFRVEIEDHGRGFDTAQADGRGVGLTSMRERAAEIGWHLSVSSAPGEGTSVVAEEKRDEEGRCADGD